MWLARIRKEQKVSVWPGLTLLECEQQLAELPELWRDYLAALTPEQLSVKVPYVNSKGESWSNTVEDILTHVILHSAYHRGQIAQDMRAAGIEPVNTDFIHAVRQSLVVG
jgi:uncharacterized damage-inducible protein DinB